MIDTYMKKKITMVVLVMVMMMGIIAGCNQASRVSENVSQEADNFNVIRRLVVINMRTDKVLFELTGAFSLQESGNRLVIVVETGDGIYKKHFTGLNNWTFYNIEDVSGASVSKYHYEVNFLPEMVKPITFVSED